AKLRAHHALRRLRSWPNWISTARTLSVTTRASADRAHQTVHPSKAMADLQPVRARLPRVVVGRRRVRVDIDQRIGPGLVPRATGGLQLALGSFLQAIFRVMARALRFRRP